MAAADCYPEAPPEPPVFYPPADAPIEWSLLSRAISFYQAKRYEYLPEAPWAVSREAVEITCPKPEFTARVEGLGSLVGSAEQSFLHMAIAGDLRDGRYVACTPCFRLGDVDDGLHFPYFMKVELIHIRSGLDPAESELTAKTEQDKVEVVFGAQLQEHFRMLQDAGACFRELGASVNMLKTEQTFEGVDILINGIEVGSYGMRRHRRLNGEEIAWTYGTGLALPRFSQAVVADPF